MMTRRTCLVAKRATIHVCIFVGVRSWKGASNLAPSHKLDLEENTSENSFISKDWIPSPVAGKTIREISEVLE